MAKHKIEGVSSIGIGETMVKGERGSSTSLLSWRSILIGRGCTLNSSLIRTSTSEPIESKKAN